MAGVTRARRCRREDSAISNDTDYKIAMKARDEWIKRSAKYRVDAEAFERVGEGRIQRLVVPKGALERLLNQ